MWYLLILKGIKYSFLGFYVYMQLQLFLWFSLFYQQFRTVYLNSSQYLINWTMLQQMDFIFSHDWIRVLISGKIDTTYNFFFAIVVTFFWYKIFLYNKYYKHKLKWKIYKKKLQQSVDLIFILVLFFNELLYYGCASFGFCEKKPPKIY